MTSQEMEEEIRILNKWAGEIAQILPTLATKDDLKPYATKEDLKAFATKEELATAVARLATKEELKAGLEDAKRYTESLILVTRHEIRQVDEKLTSVAADVKTIAEHVAILTSRRRR